MRSLQITAAGRCEIVETDRPRCGSDEVLIEMKACTICNQHDAAVFAGRAHGGPRRYPLEPGFPGHEGAGVVVEAGEGVTDLAPGDRVVTTGIGGPPLYSEYVMRQATAAVKFAESVDFPAAAPLELFGCVHRAFTLTRSVCGLRVGVVGLGLAGEAPIEQQRSALEAVREHQCEIVFECTGNPRSLEISFLLAGKDLTVFGYTDQPVEALPAVWFQKELTIRSSKILGIDDLRAVAGLLAAGEIDTRPIVTDVMSFSDYPAALERIAGGEAIKIALVWE